MLVTKNENTSIVGLVVEDSTVNTQQKQWSYRRKRRKCILSRCTASYTHASALPTTTSIVIADNLTQKHPSRYILYTERHTDTVQLQTDMKCWDTCILNVTPTLYNYKFT